MKITVLIAICTALFAAPAFASPPLDLAHQFVHMLASMEDINSDASASLKGGEDTLTNCVHMSTAYQLELADDISILQGMEAVSCVNREENPCYVWCMGEAGVSMLKKATESQHDGTAMYERFVCAPRCSWDWRCSVLPQPRPDNVGSDNSDLIVDWSGLYTGANVGAAVGSFRSVTTVDAGGYFGDLKPPLSFVPSDVSTVNRRGNQRITSDGSSGGAVLGYDWQHGSLVAGLAMDLNLFEYEWLPPRLKRICEYHAVFGKLLWGC